MTAKKETAAKSKKQSALAKQDMVGYIAPIFEELKNDIRTLDTKIEDKTHRLEVVIESMERKIRF